MPASLQEAEDIKTILMNDWDYVEFCGERMNMGVAYEKQKDYIKNLYKK